MPKFNEKGVAHLFLIVLLLLGLGLGVFLVQQRTNLKPKASTSDPISDPIKVKRASLSLDPSTTSFSKGCGHSISILLDTGISRTDGTDAILRYDPTRLTATSIITGTIYPDYPKNSIDSQNGKVSISGITSPSNPYLGKGVFAVVNFIVPNTAPVGKTQITFDFNPNTTNDSNVVESGTSLDILSDVRNGTYDITSSSCEVSNSPSPAPFIDSDSDGWSDLDEKKIGTDPKDACPDNKRDNAWPPDVDNDKKVNKSDYNSIQNSVRKKQYNKRYDLNFDGVLNINDMSIINGMNGKVCKDNKDIPKGDGGGNPVSGN